jgi:hypothetical protein
MAMVMSSITSVSGRHTGVFIVSDDPNIIKNSLALTEAFKAVTKGGGVIGNSAGGGGERKQ